MKVQKDVVMFIRYNEMTPVMIIACRLKDVFNEILVLKDCAPYGFVILGSIVSEYADAVFTELKGKYAEKLVRGDWYELSEKEVYEELINWMNS